MTDKIADIYLSVDHDIESTLVDDQRYTDVVVVFENGEKHVASFFSYESLELLNAAHRESGEFLNGKYFWAPGMVLIDECSRESIEEVIEELMEEGDFKYIFRRI